MEITSTEIEQNLISVVLGFVGFTSYCGKPEGINRGSKSRVLPQAVALQHHLSLPRVHISGGGLFLGSDRVKAPEDKRLGHCFSCKLLCKMGWRAQELLSACCLDDAPWASPLCGEFGHG